MPRRSGPHGEALGLVRRQKGTRGRPRPEPRHWHEKVDFPWER